MADSDKKLPLCAVPWTEATTRNTGQLIECCGTHPNIRSKIGQSVDDWWDSSEMQNFRKKLMGDTLPKECYKCTASEISTGTSMRTSTNLQTNLTSSAVQYPSRWKVTFGSVCNLGCFICEEYSSTVIENHKRKLQMLPIGFVSPQQTFKKQWPMLEKSILKSYEHHDSVNIFIMGGEPLYNKDVIAFLEKLSATGLSKKTKLEFQTNATQYNTRIQKLLADYKIYKNWKHISMFMSIDTVGKKAEWLRWGCDWNQIEQNVAKFKKFGAWLEVHCTISILNVGDLTKMKDWCDSIGIPLKFNLVDNPEFMSLESWPGDPDLLCDRNQMEKYGFANYYDMIGVRKNSTAPIRLKQYVEKLSTLRKSLRLYDEKLANIFNID